jgi:hypothetical protein
MSVLQVALWAIVTCQYCRWRCNLSWCFCIAGGAVSQKEPDISLSPADTEVESYVSSSHYVSCISPRGVDMRWTRDSTERITATKGRYVTSLSLSSLVLWKVAGCSGYRNKSSRKDEDILE